MLDQVRAVIRMRHYSLRTERSYCDWICRFIRFHQYRHLRDMGHAEITAFLSYLAVERRVSAGTQNQALAALLFLYRTVLEIDLPWLNDVVLAKSSERLPVVLSVEEVQQILIRLEGEVWLIASLLYGTGLRLMEGMWVRVKDIDFARREIMVRSSKGTKDRVTMLPLKLVDPLKAHLKRVNALHHRGRQGVVSPLDSI